MRADRDRGKVASGREMIRTGTIARVHEQLCPNGCMAHMTRDPALIPLYETVTALTADGRLKVADALALLRGCDAW